MGAYYTCFTKEKGAVETQVDATLECLTLNPAERQKLHEFDCKMKKTLLELRTANEQLQELQEKNEALRQQKTQLLEQNSSLKLELEGTQHVDEGVTNEVLAIASPARASMRAGR
mmetsp:Transcript_14110/g.27877  ORF Transcript_14110/g.27877 Transcript_14110/m.27877 type:complete len:115 (+) Transcript_14110:94-438(+)